MSVLEIVLAIIMGLFIVGYLVKGIYDLKHPEKVKERKERKKAKKEEKRNKKHTVIEEGEENY